MLVRTDIHKIILPFLFISLAFIPLVRAEWALDLEKSNLSFGSIKKNSIGESNHFNKIEGIVSKTGDITLIIDLSSVETWVDIRNDRMKKFFFQSYEFPVATLKGQMDLTKFSDLKVGDQMAFDTTFDLDFHGFQQTIDAELILIRLSQDTVKVIPEGIIFIDAEKFDLLPGLKKLQELAKLPSISSSVPINFHLTFNQLP